MRSAPKRRRKNAGSAVVEITLLAPWVLFLFVGVVDMGFYSYDLISVESSARVAAEDASQNTSAASDSGSACINAKADLASLPNIASLPSGFTCQTSPLVLTASLLTGSNSPDGSSATSVSVTYQTVQLIPIPGLLAGRLNITRTVVMRVKP